jgi:hypothetical protein
VPASFQIPNERRKDLDHAEAIAPKPKSDRHHHGASGRDGPLEPAVSVIDMKMQIEAVMRDGGMTMLRHGSISITEAPLTSILAFTIRPSSILTRSPISSVPSACS